MLSEERQKIILDLLQKEGAVSISDLVNVFDVTEMTIRRDLDYLESKELLRRVHGGAISHGGRSYEPPFRTRSLVNVDEKKEIGKKAASLVNNGESIILDVGTTTLEIAKNLSDKQNLTVITPSLQIAIQLVENQDIKLIVTGGILRRDELSLIGDYAERIFEDVHVDKLFLSAGGVDIDAGVTEVNLEDAVVKRRMQKCAKEIILVTDSSKFDHVALMSIAPIESINKVVTDSSISEDFKQKLTDLGIEVICV